MTRLLFTLSVFTNLMVGQTWIKLADLPGLERDDGVAVTVNGKAFFGSGLRSGWSLGGDFYCLDASNNSWSTITPLPGGAERQYACAFAGPNSFYVFSGAVVNGAQGDLYKYDLSAGTWSAMASKPGNGLQGAACFEFGDKIIVAGGKLPSGVATDEVWEYTISNDSWQQKSNFPFGGRFRASATVWNNTGYLLFGQDENNRYHRELYSYSPVADSWTKIMDFPSPQGRAYAALKTVNSRLILFGGLDSLNTYYKEVWYFDPVPATWTQGTDFTSFGRKGGMSAVVNGQFYYSCGIDVTDTRQKETWMLDLPLGVQEYKNTYRLSVYPNPCSGSFIISAEAATGIRLMDESGQTVMQAHLSQNTTELNVAHLAPGIYLIVAEKNGSCFTRKVAVSN